MTWSSNLRLSPSRSSRWPSSRKTKADQEKLALRTRPPLRRGPDLHGQNRRGDRPDHHFRNGRAPPGDHRRSHHAASSKSRPTPARLRSPTARPSPKRPMAKAKLVKQSGGRGQYGHVILSMSAERKGQGAHRSKTRSSAARSPRNIINAVIKGAAQSMTNGVVAGYPVVDVHVDVLGRFLSTMSIRTRTPSPWRRSSPCGTAFKNAGSILLEPIMGVEVSTPDDYQGDVMGDLNRRRGQIQHMESKGNRSPSSTPTFRSRKCSATPPPSARFPQVVLPTR